MSKESAYFKLEGVTGRRGSEELKRGLDALRGVISVSVNSEKNTLAVDYDNSGVNAGQLKKRVKALGYTIEDEKTEEHRM